MFLGAHSIPCNSPSPKQHRATHGKCKKSDQQFWWQHINAALQAVNSPLSAWHLWATEEVHPLPHTCICIQQIFVVCESISLWEQILRWASAWIFVLWSMLYVSILRVALIIPSRSPHVMCIWSCYTNVIYLCKTYKIYPFHHKTVFTFISVFLS